MIVTGLGHAGLHIQGTTSTILCDPWTNAAFDGALNPFPHNRGLDWEALSQVSFLYISHRHEDHLLDLSAVQEFGHYNAHFLQFSGAIWWPMVYDLPLRGKQAFAKLKRSAQLRRALLYARRIGADAIFPFAGPPAFYKDELFS